MSQNAQGTGQSAQEVLKSAGELALQSEVLRAEVDGFIQKVREG